MASKKLKLEEKIPQISLKFERPSDEENTNLENAEDPLDYDLDSSLVIYCEGDSNECPEEKQGDIKQNGVDDLIENSTSKDQILRETMYKIVVEKNVSTEVTESLLTMLFNYGIRVPLTKIALINEFQTINDETISKQYTDLKKQMNKMEDTLEQLKHAVLKIKGSVGPMHEIRVNIPIQTEKDLELLEHECAEKDLTPNFMKFKYLSDVIEDHVLLQYNWDGVQKKKKLSDFTHLHQTLYSAFENETISDFPSYRNFVKAELRRIHNRHHQKLSRKRRSLMSNSFTMKKN